MTKANNSMSTIAWTVFALVLCAMTSGANADQPTYEGELVLEFQNDYASDSDDSNNVLNDTYGSAELTTSFHFNKFFSINSTLLFENVLEPTRPGKDRFFEGHGLYVEALNVQFNVTKNTSLLAGKYAPAFGTAWDVSPGIYGPDFAEDYELTERLGLAIGHNFGSEDIGTALVTGHIFTQDTTVLSNSVFAKRGKTLKSSGGAGNTKKLNNYALTLDLADLQAAEGLSLHFGYRHLSKGVDSVSNETGYVAGFTYEMQISQEVSAALNGEFVHLENSGGGADDQNYFTAGISLGYDRWHLDIAGTQRNTDVAAGNDVKDELFQASIGYRDQYDIDWNIGYKFSEEGRVDTHFLAVFITRSIGFDGKFNKL